MASYTTRPNRQGVDLDPYELLQKVLEHATLKPYLPPGIEMPDLLTSDIEEQNRLDQFPEGWLDTKKEEANNIMDRLKIDKEKYEIWIGHQSWAQEQWAAPVELRIKKSNRAVHVSSSFASYDLDETIKHLYNCAEKEQTAKANEESEKMEVMLWVKNSNHFERYFISEQMKLMDRCSLGKFGADIAMIENKDDSNGSQISYTADERFAKLFTVLRIWKEREFDTIDTEGAFSLYAFALMLVHFLQVGCQPPVLPTLSDLGLVYHGLGINCFRDHEIKFRSQNKKSLGNLLFNFFNYYETTRSGGFDFVHWKISTKEAKAIRLDEPSKTFYIEGPFSVASVNVVHESESSGTSHMLAVTFMQCRARLMKDRRLNQLENFILA